MFDDPDSQTLEGGRAVYRFLADQGLRTTKGVWPVAPPREPSDHGGTCGDPAYRAWALELQREGFEIGYHNTTPHTSTRAETIEGLNAFGSLFGREPVTMAQHYYCEENVYWGDARLGGWRRAAYNLLTRGGNRGRFFGEHEGHPLYWGDICGQRVKFVRNFVFGDINTLKACPWMPYHDPQRPAVNYWYASSEGAKCPAFIDLLHEANQERLEEEGGACIVYTHFGHGFYEHGSLDSRFCDLVRRLGRRNGWFVPVRGLLEYLLSLRGGASGEISPAARSRLERQWLLQKIRVGTA